MFGSLVSNSKLYSYLISSFLDNTEGFLSKLLFSLCPWPSVWWLPATAAAIDLSRVTPRPFKMPNIESRSFLSISRGDTAPCTYGNLLYFFIRVPVVFLIFLVPEWFKLIESRTIFEFPMIAWGEMSFGWDIGKYLLPATPPPRIGLLVLIRVLVISVLIWLRWNCYKWLIPAPELLPEFSLTTSKSLEMLGSFFKELFADIPIFLFSSLYGLFGRPDLCFTLAVGGG